MPTAKTNFEPLSDIQLIQRRSRDVADVTLINPLNALCILDGEWLTLDDNGKLVRASNVASLGNAATKRAYVCWSERGRSDVQSVRKLDYFDLGPWEADTRIFDAAVTIGGGAPITAVEQRLKVATISIVSPSGTRNFTGLVGAGAAEEATAYVRALPSTNGGKLRIYTR